MHLTRRFNALLAGVAISAGSLVGVGLAVAPSAVAAPTAAKGTTCSAAVAKATIKPGITLTPAKTTLTASFSASRCTRVDGATGISGKIVLKAKKLGCTSGSATGTFTATTRRKVKSSGTMTLKATSTPLVFDLTGKVAKGYLAGSKISGTFDAKPTGGNCVLSPLTKATITNKPHTKFKL